MNVVQLYDTWFTSDTHFYHKRIQEFCPNTRKGKDENEMTELMIQAWNERIKPYDKVYHLGDFSFGSSKQTFSLLGRLNGIIHLIKGNHDKVVEIEHIGNQFKWIKDYAFIRMGSQKIALCHFPIESWDQKHRGAWHFHGHLHGDGHHDCRKLENRIDVGIDTRKDREMYPYHYEELVRIVKNGGH